MSARKPMSAGEVLARQTAFFLAAAGIPPDRLADHDSRDWKLFIAGYECAERASGTVRIPVIKEGDKIGAAPVTAAAPAGLIYPPIPQHVIDLIADSWDGCMYDGVGEMIDIGASIRRAMKGIGGKATEVAAPAAPSAAPAPESQSADERELFEKFATRAKYVLDWDDEGYYMSGDTDSAWDGWKSRAALSAPAAPVPAASEAPLLIEAAAALESSAALDEQNDVDPFAVEYARDLAKRLRRAAAPSTDQQEG